jgi:hypothetical protein
MAMLKNMIQHSSKMLNRLGLAVSVTGRIIAEDTNLGAVKHCEIHEYIIS